MFYIDETLEDRCFYWSVDLDPNIWKRRTIILVAKVSMRKLVSTTSLTHLYAHLRIDVCVGFGTELGKHCTTFFTIGLGS